MFPTGVCTADLARDLYSITTEAPPLRPINRFRALLRMSAALTMPYMSFHPDFWIATAAAAPLIATTTAVALVPSFEALRRTRDGRLAANPVSVVLYVLGGVVGEANFIFQAIVLATSLKSLAGGNDSAVVSMGAIEQFELNGLILVFVQTVLVGVASTVPQRRRSRGPEDYPGEVQASAATLSPED